MTSQILKFWKKGNHTLDLEVLPLIPIREIGEVLCWQTNIVVIIHEHSISAKCGQLLNGPCLLLSHTVWVILDILPSWFNSHTSWQDTYWATLFYILVLQASREIQKGYFSLAETRNEIISMVNWSFYYGLPWSVSTHNFYGLSHASLVHLDTFHHHHELE